MTRTQAITGTGTLIIKAQEILRRLQTNEQVILYKALDKISRDNISDDSIRGNIDEAIAYLFSYEASRTARLDINNPHYKL